MLQNVDLLANLTATKKGETITYEVKKVEVKQGQTSLATLTVSFYFALLFEVTE